MERHKVKEVEIYVNYLLRWRIPTKFLLYYTKHIT